VKDLTERLGETPTLRTVATLRKVAHNTSQEDVRLIISRFKKVVGYKEKPELESETPKSRVELAHEEFKTLLKFIQKNYEPFRQGVKAFLPLDKPFEAESAKQIKALFSLPNKQKIIEFITQNDVIPEDIALGLIQAQRVRAVHEFESMLEQDLTEPDWQKWFEKHSWMLGHEFIQVIDERRIDPEHISDFLMKSYDGFLDIVEIKRPGGTLTFWAAEQDHRNYIPSSHLIKAITQASQYIYEVEREADSRKFSKRVGSTVVKPRCVLVFGRSDTWNNEHIEAYRILNASFHNITILTYDHVLARARRIVGFE
jgi:hypothetical protein